MAAVKEMLLETLNDLSYQELKKFKEVLQLTVSQKDLPDISLMLINRTDRVDMVNLMLQNYGQQSVDLTKKIFKKMSRSDLVQRLSDTSSGPKEKQRSSLPQKDITMTSVKKKILETLEELSFGEIKVFKWFLLQMKDLPQSRIERADRMDLVDLMVNIYSQQSVKVTREVLKKMNRMDLVQRLSDTSSGSKVDLMVEIYGQQSVEVTREVLKKMNRMDLVQSLSDTSSGSKGEIEQFKWLLQHLQMNDRPRIPRSRIERADRMDLVDLMVEIYGQQSVEVTREVLKKMSRMDLVQRLSDTSSGSEELHLGEIKIFKWLLQNLQMKDLPRISRSRIERADRMDLVDLMVEIYGQQSVEVTREVLKKMNRMDLVQSLSNTSSGSKGPSGSLEFGGHGSIMDSSDWTKLEPEVNSTDADEAPTYSLQSEAGRFECSVSDLRWVCEEKVSFKYQFWSWEEHMERMESLQYMPAGPLLDITVIAGKLNEVYLPHWICTDDSTILDKFAVLHIDACGDVVEDVSETVKKEEESKGYEMGDSKSSPNNYLKLRKTFVLTSDIKTAEIQPELQHHQLDQLVLQ
eukprot:superscaffoldBa00006323_g21399